MYFFLPLSQQLVYGHTHFLWSSERSHLKLFQSLRGAIRGAIIMAWMLCGQGCHSGGKPWKWQRPPPPPFFRIRDMPEINEPELSVTVRSLQFGRNSCGFSLNLLSPCFPCISHNNILNVSYVNILASLEIIKVYKWCHAMCLSQITQLTLKTSLQHRDSFFFLVTQSCGFGLCVIIHIVQAVAFWGQ